MAKNEATKKSDETTTTTAAPAAALTAASTPIEAAAAVLATTGPSAELAAALEGVDIGDGGLGEVDQTDIKIAAKVFNFKGLDANKDPIPKNVFYDTVQETTSKSLDAVLLDLHKTKEWREYDEAEKKSKVRCRSQSTAENAIGTMDDGKERPCKGCPDAQWHTITTKEGKQKRTRNCGPVYNTICSDLETGDAFVVRFKKTSLPVIQGHLNKHHIGKLALGGGRRANVPLFAMAVRIGLKMHESGEYSLPVIEKGRVLNNREVERYAADSKFYREVVLPVMDKIAEKDQDGGAEGGGDASFNPSEFGGDDARPSSARNGDRFADDRAR